MLLCNEAVTIVRHERETNSDRYTCTVVTGASWFGKKSTALTTSGEAPKLEYTVRIPAACAPPELPRAGDYMVRGELASADNAASFADREYFRIGTVGDNRRGIIPHLVVRS